jgi:hypothetical protein
VPKTVSQFTMVSSREVIIENHQSNAIELISLTLSPKYIITLQFMIQTPNTSSSSLLCDPTPLPDGSAPKGFQTDVFFLGWVDRGNTCSSESPRHKEYLLRDTCFSSQQPFQDGLGQGKF